MVKRTLPILLSAALLAVCFAGCSGTGTPVHPKGGAPVVELRVADAVALWAPDSDICVKYRVWGESHPVVAGAVTVFAGQTIETIAIPLPEGGPKVVASEWFDFGRGMVGNPLYLGAGQVEVYGNTPFTLKMGSLENCYYGYVYDGYADFCLDEGGPSSMVANDFALHFPVMDVVELMGIGDVVFTYLGGGDLLDHVEIPASAAWSPTTSEAKAAPIALGDVYGVKLPSLNAYAWLQVVYVYVSGDVGEIDFIYRYNNEGNTLCVFDETTYGAMTCNEHNVN